MKIRVSPPHQICASASSFGDRQARFLVQNHWNFKKSAEPVRVMYYDGNGSWVDYPKEVLDSVKLSFLGGKPIVEVNIRDCEFLLDFYRMLEIELDNGNEKSIAWIDVKGKCFFPKIFVNSNQGFVNCDGNEEILRDKCPKIEIEVKILGDSEHNSESFSNRKRVCEDIEVEQVERGKFEGCSSNVGNLDAKRRRIVACEMGEVKWKKTKLLKEWEREYVIVKNLFLSGLRMVDPGATITRIHKCTRTGPLDKARYESFMKRMEIMKKIRGDANMVFAWHGASAKVVECILAHGFGMLDEVQPPQPHGVGVYLSPAKFPHISAMMSEVDDNGEKHVILCRVLLGKYEKVDASSKQKLPSTLDFDTGVDHLTDPKLYVVWPTNMSTHILPEVVISYKPSNHLQGQVTGTSSVKLVPRVSNPFVAKLFSKLGRSLPSPKIQQLQTLCGAFKDGKLGKDMFMGQLRSVVGDEMLRSTIHEIRG
ncbi:hypothetical protein ACH5RR_027047 [Cinchona calisaya]|uniref:Poly [ADP-ribose] polymerase n=1 Tax=Cinchona calisaya TaxID=153742 RepID=A0ABD2Z7L7_9GENT